MIWSTSGGIGFVPEDRRVFAELTVWENLDVAARAAGRSGYWTLDAVYGLFPKLRELRNRPGGYLSGGEQQMLTVARTLMGNPELLLLDEPSEGLAPLVVESLLDNVRALKAEGVTILLAEQGVDFSLALADRVYILEKGSIRHTGPAAELRDDTALRDPPDSKTRMFRRCWYSAATRPRLSHMPVTTRAISVSESFEAA